jgi:hypothetical protein
MNKTARNILRAVVVGIGAGTIEVGIVIAIIYLWLNRYKA